MAPLAGYGCEEAMQLWKQGHTPVCPSPAFGGAFFLSYLLLSRVHTHQAAISTINQGSSERKKTSPSIKTPAVIAIRLVCDFACVVMKRHRGRIDIPV